MSQITTLPLSALVASPGNVRTTKNTDIESLAASILAQGLLQNLVVVPSVEFPGKYEVAAGERRMTALKLLAERNQIESEYPVGVNVREREELTELSLTENVQRANMNPADESAAFAKLTEEEGMTVDAIADRFGVQPKIVEQRLAMAKASPALLQLVREGKMTSAQLRALCATDDHAKQEAVWESAWNKDPDCLRRIILQEAVKASDRRVSFIGGLEAYKAAGGPVRGDLFGAAEGGGFIEDVELLDRLVVAKLEEVAEQERAKGWLWVEVSPEFSWDAYHRCAKTHATETQLSAAQTEAIATLEAEAESLTKERDQLVEDNDDQLSDEDDERYDDLNNRIEEIRDEVKEIHQSAQVYPAAVMASAGVMIGLHGDSVRIERGLIRAEDRKAASEAGAAMLGGRETNAAGRKPNAISDALRRELLVHRNVAVQSELAKNAKVAKVTMAFWAVCQLRGAVAMGYGESGPVKLSSRMTYGSWQPTSNMGQDVQNRTEAYDQQGRDLVADLPTKDKKELWNALLASTDEKLDALIAYGVSTALELESGHSGLTALLLEALNFDMADHFEPTATNYLGRNLKKDQIVKVLGEVGQAHGKDALLAMKTKDLAKEAQARMHGTRWVPKEIRTPGKEPVKPAKAAKRA